jgi:Tol biopolymer transport system component
MQVQTRRQVFLAVSWTTFLCGSVSLAILHGAEAEQKEWLLHVQGSVILLGYISDDTLFVARDREELTLQPPGTKRGGHPTYPSLSRDGTIVATSYVKSPYPHYREGIATYSLVDRQWKQYDFGDFTNVWTIAISPDGSTLAFEAERHWSQPRQLLLLNLKTGDATVLIEPFLAITTVSWSPDGRHIVYEAPVRRPDATFDFHGHEIRIRDVSSQEDRRLVSGSDPSWSPSGEWIAYLDSAGAVAIVRPDGTEATTLVSLRRSPPWFYKRYFMFPPIWSPDSKTLLLNEAAMDETARALIHEFDLGSRKLRQKMGKGVAVLGWTR